MNMWQLCTMLHARICCGAFDVAYATGYTDMQLLLGHSASADIVSLLPVVPAATIMWCCSWSQCVLPRLRQQPAGRRQRPRSWRQRRNR